MDQTSNLLNHFKIQPTVVKYIIQEFQKPVHENVFRLNLDYLLRGADLVKFADDKWKRRPELFSLLHYEYSEFFHIILLANNMGSRFEFIPKNLITPFYIVAPKSDNIINLLDIRV